MSDRFFIDTNILVNAYNNSKKDLHCKYNKFVINLMRENNLNISTQILSELSHVLLHKMKFPCPEVNKVVSDLIEFSNEKHKLPHIILLELLIKNFLKQNLEGHRDKCLEFFLLIH